MTTVREILMQMPSDKLVSIERMSSDEPVQFGEVSKLINHPIGGCTVKVIYPEYYKGRLQTGITIKVERC